MYDHILITYFIIMLIIGIAFEMNWKAAIIGAILVSMSNYNNGYILDWYRLYLIACGMFALSFVCSRYVLIVLAFFNIGKRF